MIKCRMHLTQLVPGLFFFFSHLKNHLKRVFLLQRVTPHVSANEVSAHGSIGTSTPELDHLEKHLHLRHCRVTRV